MSAVLRLVLMYFAATPLQRGLSAIGLIFILVGAVSRVFVSGSVFTAASYGPDAGMAAILLLSLPWFGMLLLVAATTLMPAIVERLAVGRSTGVLPGGRARLLASMLLAAGVLSSIVACEATVAFIDFQIEASYMTVFYRTLFMAFIDFGLIYAAIWLVTKTNGVWRLAGVLWIVVSIGIPLRYIGGIPALSPLEGFGLASWIVFGSLVLSGGRVRRSFRNAIGHTRVAFRRLLPATSYRPGHELDLMLGTTHPWFVAIGQIVPIAVMAILIREPRVWLAVLMMFSAMAGAVACQAGHRSRQIWLKLDVTRDVMARQVESAFWRYNAPALGVLVLVFLALSVLAGFDSIEIGFGVTLLILGCTACTYLGLMITRELGWFEASLCILTMAALVIAAIGAMRGNFLVAIQLEALLLALTILFRWLAMSRWAGLDWMRCRAERHLGARSSA
jgi:hypothetical protein